MSPVSCRRCDRGCRPPEGISAGSRAGRTARPTGRGSLGGHHGRPPADSARARVFFASCVAVAGLFGAATSSRKILFVQTVPALVVLALVLSAH
ncbi:DUF1304 domain-containing protein [Kitasatospora sp. NPDC018058]|uniref:DUF1304 domain-containing protein n=1 Tax=Kitasatospora sp. NPDC018058 TaxID=3364025 RepID=UPI0037C0F3CE